MALASSLPLNQRVVGSIPTAPTTGSRGKRATPRPSLPAVAEAADAGIAVDIDADQQAEAEHDGQHRRAAIGDQRQRHSEHRDETHHDRGLDEDMEKEIDGDAEAEQPAEMAAAAQRDGEAVDEDQRIKSEQGDAADETELLGQHGEDEVGLLLGQEVEMALRAVQEALAEEPARAERDLRLQDVIAGAERIVLGVEKGVDAVALVFRHMAPGR